MTLPEFVQVNTEVDEMKMAFVSNQHYMRGVDVTSAIVFELGDALAEGDELSDVVSGQNYLVASRGLNPKRSTETASRLHWSREASVAFRGNCKCISRRLLFAGDVGGLGCQKLVGSITSKTAKIPSGVPIIGLVTLQDYDSPGVLLADENLRYQLLVAVKKSESVLAESVLFSCIDPSNQALNLTLSVKESFTADESGPLMCWDEPVSEAAMV